jgi:hypothetical protein
VALALEAGTHITTQVSLIKREFLPQFIPCRWCAPSAILRGSKRNKTVGWGSFLADICMDPTRSATMVGLVAAAEVTQSLRMAG